MERSSVLGMELISRSVGKLAFDECAGSRSWSELHPCLSCFSSMASTVDAALTEMFPSHFSLAVWSTGQTVGVSSAGVSESDAFILEAQTSLSLWSTGHFSLDIGGCDQ